MTPEAQLKELCGVRLSVEGVMGSVWARGCSGPVSLALYRPRFCSACPGSADEA
jgi:hypothetical protein